jgi:hypothetical protein
MMHNQKEKLRRKFSEGVPLGPLRKPGNPEVCCN